MLTAWVTGAALCAVAHASPPLDEAAKARAFEWVAAPLTVPEGGRGSLVIELLIPEGVEVFGPDVHVTVVDAMGLSVGEPVLPAVERHADVDDTHGAVARYTGSLTLHLPVSVGDAAPGLRRLVVRTEVRGCSARACHAGTRVDLPVYVHVLAAGAGADASARR